MQKLLNRKTIIILSILLVLMLASIACSIDIGNVEEPQNDGQNQPVDEGDSAQETEIARQEIELGVQQTQLAQTQTQMAIQATNITVPLPTNTSEAQPTQAPTLSQPTLAPPTQEPPAPDYPDLETWINSVNILLYEDMSGDFGTTRFIKAALDEIEIPYTDVKDASGHFKNALLNGAPGGEPWDLIIAASELRSGVTGEFFEYYSEALWNGSSLIVEVWNMDSFVNGKIQLLLEECGVKYQADWWEPKQNEKLLTNHAPDHPIMNIFHEDIRMTSLLDYWGWFSDQGDLMQLDYTGDAQIILGARTNQDTSYGTVVSCIQDRFILQTHSTHTYAIDRSVPLWQNYIITTLLARYLYLYPDADIDL